MCVLPHTPSVSVSVCADMLISGNAVLTFVDIWQRVIKYDRIYEVVWTNNRVFDLG